MLKQIYARDIFTFWRMTIKERKQIFCCWVIKICMYQSENCFCTTEKWWWRWFDRIWGSEEGERKRKTRKRKCNILKYNDKYWHSNGDQQEGIQDILKWGKWMSCNSLKMVTRNGNMYDIWIDPFQNISLFLTQVSLGT